MRIDTIPEGALLMYDNNQQSALGVKNCKVNMELRQYALSTNIFFSPVYAVIFACC
jgi:hypothetical protein